MDSKFKTNNPLELLANIEIIDSNTGKVLNQYAKYDHDRDMLVINVDLTNNQTKTENNDQKEINKHAVKFFIPSFPLPSDDPNLKSLREKYFKELEALENKEGGCRACDKGKLMRKYAVLVDKYYQNDNDDTLKISQ